MQQTGMNTLYTKVSSVREQLILFAGQMESLEQDYNTVVAELENSFVDSKAFWERTTTEKKATASQKAGVALERLDQMASGLNLLDVQLSQVDQSYAKRHDAIYGHCPECYISNRRSLFISNGGNSKRS